MDTPESVINPINPPSPVYSKGLVVGLKWAFLDKIPEVLYPLSGSQGLKKAGKNTPWKYRGWGCPDGSSGFIFSFLVSHTF